MPFRPFRKSILVSVLALTTACQTTVDPGADRRTTDAELFGLTVMTQMLIIGGATAGFAAFPLLVAADIHSANEAMERSENRATLEDTYKFAYNRDLGSVGANGNTGEGA